MAEKTKPETKRQEPSSEVKALKCKDCGKELKRIVFDSRAPKPTYVYVCEDRDCILYRQPQSHKGKLPIGPGGLPIQIKK